MTPLSSDDLNTLLNSWPEGTPGHDQDLRLICLLDSLGREAGYGWLEQLAHWLYVVRLHGDGSQAASVKAERFATLGWPLPENFDDVARKVTPSARSGPLPAG